MSRGCSSEARLCGGGEAGDRNEEPKGWNHLRGREVVVGLWAKQLRPDYAMS